MYVYGVGVIKPRSLIQLTQDNEGKLSNGVHL